MMIFGKRLNKLLNMLKKHSIKLPETGFSTEPAVKGFDKKDVLASIAGKSQITHDELNTLAHLYFNITIKNCLYTQRNVSGYGQIFEIVNVQVEHEDNKLGDIIITLKEVGLDQMLLMTVSIKDFHEVFSEYTPNFNLTIHS